MSIVNLPPPPQGSTEAIAFSRKSESLLLTLSMLTVDPLYIDCWSSPHWLSICPPPPRSTEAITFSHKSESWLLILFTLIVDPPPRIKSVDRLCGVDCWSSPGRLSIDPPYISNLNIRIPGQICLCISMRYAGVTDNDIICVLVTTFRPSQPDRLMHFWYSPFLANWKIRNKEDAFPDFKVGL